MIVNPILRTELVPIPNATTGLNAVIKSVITGEEDGCFMLDIGG